MRELHTRSARGRRLPPQRPVPAATRTRPTTRSSCRSSSTGGHVFTACRQGAPGRLRQRLPTTYIADGAGRLRGGRADLPCVRIQREYEDIDDIIRMCRRRIRVPDHVVRRLPGARWAPRGSASGAVKELVARYGVGHGRRGSSGVVRLLASGRMTERDRELPPGTWTGTTAHDPFPGLPRRHPAQGHGRRRRRTGGTIVVDLRDNPDCVPAGINQSGTTRHQPGDHRRLQLD